MRMLGLMLRTLRGEVAVALVTGLIAFGISEAFVPHAHILAGAFGLLAATVAGALDTLFFHLLFLLREAPVHTANSRYVRSVDDAKHRLADGSIRLREALIRRFEADYQRTAAFARADGHARRQLREARRRRRSRLWVVEEAIPGHQLTAATVAAKTDPDLLEKWTDQVDALVDTQLEIQRRQSFVGGLVNRLRPAQVSRQALAEWTSSADHS